MKDYKTIREFDSDLAECKLEIYKILQKYNFQYDIANNVLMDVVYTISLGRIQEYRTYLMTIPHEKED